MRCLAVLTVKNEGAFLLEWLAHHRAVGFTDFLVFSNDCTDGTDRMLERLAEIGQIVHVPNPGPWPRGPQWAALKRADAHPLTRAADWVLCLDIDEFVNIHAGAGTLPDLLAALPDADAIPLTWRLFGNCGVVDYHDGRVTESFPRAAPARMVWPWRAAMFKTLFRNDGRYRKLGVQHRSGARRIAALVRRVGTRPAARLPYGPGLFDTGAGQLRACPDQPLRLGRDAKLCAEMRPRPRQP